MCEGRDWTTREFLIFMSGLFCNKQNECDMSIVMTATFFLCFHGNNGFSQGTCEDLWWRV